MKTHTINRTPIWIAASLALLVLALCASQQPAQAGSKVIFSESELVFEDLVSVPQYRTFYIAVEGDPVKNLKIITQDLLEVDGNAVLLSENIQVTPDSFAELSGQQTVKVTISGASHAGHYEGHLDILYDGLPADQPLELDMDVSLRATPSVETDINSKEVLLFAQQAWNDLPWLGLPSASLEAAPLSQSTLSLIYNGQEGEAEVVEARVLTMRNDKGETLPEDAVRVTTGTPFSIPAGGTHPLQVVAAGRDFEAGQYSGTLRIQVRDQASVIQQNVNLKVKHAWPLPLLVLAGGLGLGYFLHWWSEDGLKVQQYYTRVKTLAVAVRSANNKLQEDARTEIEAMLKEAIELINQNAGVTKIQEKVEAAEAAQKRAVDQADTLLGELEAMKERIKAVQIGEKVCARTEKDLSTLASGVTSGGYPDLEAPKRVANRYALDIKALEEARELFDKLDAQKQAEMRGPLDQASSPTEMKTMIQAAAGVKEGAAPVPGGLPYSLGEMPEATRALLEALRIDRQRDWQLKSGGVIAGLVGYLFVLAVGWSTLYLAVDTFGADLAQHYGALFLWGSVAESLRGKAMKLSELKMTFTSSENP
ncbi:MAG: hypothetical protein AB1894_26750 [Chloroflexota bacterium]